MVKKRQKFSDALRKAISESDKTRYRISKETGISQPTLSRFMHRRSGLSIESIDRVCECLGLRLVTMDDIREWNTR